MKKIYALLALAFLLPLHGYAKTFANQFIEFQLPDKWECQLDGTEWVCQSTDEQKKRDAIIVLAAKIKKAGMDELSVYKAHLEKPQTYQSLSGESVTSEPRYVKQIDISGKPWIDSLHLQSEIPDFYTRYLATVESDLGILVTFSVRKDKYEEYAPQIEAMVKSLKAFRKAGGVNDIPGGAGGLGEAPPIFNAAGEGGGGGPKKPAGESDDTGALVLVALLAAGGVGFFLWKKKKKR
jgi:LPXTG-motif cell wall-anchored protein